MTFWSRRICLRRINPVWKEVYVWLDIKKNAIPISGQNFNFPFIWTERSRVKLYIMVSKIQTNSCKGMCRHSKPILYNNQVSLIMYFCKKLHPFVKLSLTYAHLWKVPSTEFLSFPYPYFTGILPLSFHTCNIFPVTACVWSHSILHLVSDFPESANITTRAFRLKFILWPHNSLPEHRRKKRRRGRKKKKRCK